MNKDLQPNTTGGRYTLPLVVEPDEFADFLKIIEAKSKKIGVKVSRSALLRVYIRAGIAADKAEIEADAKQGAG